jgi:hypothetical protein
MSKPKRLRDPIAEIREDKARDAPRRRSKPLRVAVRGPDGSELLEDVLGRLVEHGYVVADVVHLGDGFAEVYLAI